jgi:tetratricopeptide (TPR) repeat protein
MVYKYLLLIVAVICIPYLTYAKDRPINELPMYGGKHNPKVEQNKEFSKSAADLGWKYYYNNELDTAMKRFNQAWLLDRNSVDAIWGFGLIMGRRASEELPEYNIKESIRFLTLAAEKAPHNVRIIVDLAFSHTVYGIFLKDTGNKSSHSEFLKAARIYETALKLDMKYPPLHSNWSVLEFYMGNYIKAKKRLEQAINLGFKADPAYVRELESKLTK